MHANVCAERLGRVADAGPLTKLRFFYLGGTPSEHHLTDKLVPLPALSLQCLGR